MYKIIDMTVTKT